MIPGLLPTRNGYFNTASNTFHEMRNEMGDEWFTQRYDDMAYAAEIKESNEMSMYDDESERGLGEGWYDHVCRNANANRVTTKESNVKTNEQLMAERDVLLLKAAERVTQRETYGTDPFKNGDMLKIMITYGTSDVSYTYAGIKIRNRFYLSGKVQSQRSFVNPSGITSDGSVPPLNIGWTYDHFVAWLAAGDASVWIVEKIKKVF